MKWLQILITKFTGARYWYSVRVEYRQKHSGIILATANPQIGLTHKAFIFNRRVTAKDLVPSDVIYNTRKLHGCTINVTPVAYLGLIKK